MLFQMQSVLDVKYHQGKPYSKVTAAQTMFTDAEMHNVFMLAFIQSFILILGCLCLIKDSYPDLCIRGNLSFSILLKKTLACILEKSNHLLISRTALPSGPSLTFMLTPK